VECVTILATAKDWTEELTQNRRVQVPDLLTPDFASRLHRALREQSQWNLVFRHNGEHMDIGADSVDLWDDAQQKQFDRVVFEVARDSFQYLYKNVPIYDLYHNGRLAGHFFGTLFEFLNSAQFLNFGRELTGCADIGFCDAQATSFEAGHFLSVHDDNVAGKNRVAAYVLSMTADWNVNWGGALQFFDDSGNVTGGFRPAFNTLNAFLIPQRHAVEYVTPFSGAARLSITGWFRRGTDPRN